MSSTSLKRHSQKQKERGETVLGELTRVFVITLTLPRVKEGFQEGGRMVDMGCGPLHLLVQYERLTSRYKAKPREEPLAMCNTSHWVHVDGKEGRAVGSCPNQEYLP